MRTGSLVLLAAGNLTGCASMVTPSGPPAAFPASSTGSSAASSGAITKGQLGSMENPVRVNMPPGERAYLNRLRCSDGKAPEYERQGSGGPAKDGHIVDFYAVTCAGEKAVTIIMDMYHGAAPNDPVPGFTIVGG